MRPSFQELKDLWLFGFARSSLHEAVACLDAIPSAAIDIVRRALLSAALVAYARPFSAWQVTSSERVVPLANINPPAHLLQNHKDAIAVRNKLIGHKDATPGEGHSTTANMILLHVTPTHFDLRATMVDSMDEPARTALRELCMFFINHCEGKLGCITRVYHSEITRNDPGHYELLVAEPPGEWIRPFRRPSSAA